MGFVKKDVSIPANTTYSIKINQISIFYHIIQYFSIKIDIITMKNCVVDDICEISNCIMAKKDFFGWFYNGIVWLFS